MCVLCAPLPDAGARCTCPALAGVVIKRAGKRGHVHSSRRIRAGPDGSQCGRNVVIPDVKRLLTAFAALVVAASAAASNVTLIAPQEGSQVIGPSVIEATTDAPGVNRVEFYVDGVLAGVARTAPYRIAYDFGEKMTSREVVAKVLSNGYRTTDSARVVTAALTAGESITVDLVEIPLRVRSTRTLQPSDIRIQENSRAQSVRDLKPGRGPAHFSFIVDRSSSMGDGKLAAAMRAVEGAVKLLRPDDTHSLTLFNHTVSSGPFEGVVPSGGTSLRDAVVAGLSDKRTYAIVITDGGDRNSVLTDEDALRKVSGTRTVVAAVVLGRAGSFLRSVTSNTGGTLVDGSRETVSKDVARIITDINSRYTVTYQSEGTKRGWRTIKVSAARRGVEVLASRKGYYAE